MAMGIPVITNSGVGDVAEIVTKYKAGFVVNDFSDNEFLSVVNDIAGGVQFDNSNIRKGAFDFYALPEAISRYREVYEAVFKR